MASDSHTSPPDPMGGLFDFKSMIDAMEIARRSWSTMPIPSAMQPTLDPEELDKRIADLKTVEQWLVLNLNLLRGSMQALQLQRDTLSSLQSFGAAARAAAEAATGAGTRATADSATTAGGRPNDGGATNTRDTSQPRAESAASTAQSDPAIPPGGIDPTAWWHTLQSQFQQVAESAFAGMRPTEGSAQTKPPRKASKAPRARSRSPKGGRTAAGTAPARPRRKTA